MRSILQNVVAFDLELRTGMQLGWARLSTFTAAASMAQDQPVILFVTPTNQQNLVLPSIAGLTATPGVLDGRVHIIINEAASGTVQVEAHADDNFVTVGSAITSQKGGLMLIADTVLKTWVPITIP
jgi:hypothetical protein